MLKITRRDFVNSTLAGAGATLLTAPAPLARAGLRRPAPPPALPEGWYGFGGVGDYASSHGNTPETVAQAHAIHQGAYDQAGADWIDTGEFYDLVVVGAGMAGLGAAYEFAATMPKTARCLILDNHPVFGGESKQNEFEVKGQHLTAPQGANGFSIPPVTTEEPAYAVGDAYYYDRLGAPREFTYSEPAPEAASIRFGNDNYGFVHWLWDRIDVSHFYKPRAPGQAARHVVNVWDNRLQDLPLPERARADLLAWNETRKRPHGEDGLGPWLDSMSCKDYLEKILGLDPAVTAYVDPIIADAMGSACDVTSAFAMFSVNLPGFKGYRDDHINNRHSFPGGNTGFARYFIKRIMPQAIAGRDDFADIINGDIRFDQLDRPEQPVRMRLSSTVVRVEHSSREASQSDWAWVSYARGGKVYRLRARAVIMASGGWVNKHVVKDLPEAQRAAFDSFNHAAFLVANVALNNWEFMWRLGVSGCRYEGEFGFACNLRRPMVVGDRRSPLAPSEPAVLTFYVPMFTPGRAAAEQGNIGRLELFSTPYAGYERQIIRQLEELFAASGFKAERDIAGIVLNRWGHAYIMPEPGFFFGRNGKAPARQTASQRHGRIGFGHSEFRGLQHWGPAASEGRRAFNDLRHFL